MKSKIMDLFITSGKIITSPDELLNLRNHDTDYMGILVSIFFSAFLGLIMGIFTKSALTAIMFMIFFVIMVLVRNLIQTIIIYIFTRILGAKGGFIQTFNMISYADAIDIFIILAMALFVFKPFFIMLAPLALVWRSIIQIIAVDTVYDIGFGRSFLCYVGFLALILIIIMGMIL